MINIAWRSIGLGKEEALFHMSHGFSINQNLWNRKGSQAMLKVRRPHKETRTRSAKCLRIVRPTSSPPGLPACFVRPMQFAKTGLGTGFVRPSCGKKSSTEGRFALKQVDPSAFKVAWSAMLGLQDQVLAPQFPRLQVCVETICMVKDG